MKLADGLKENLDALGHKAGLISLDTGIADSGVSRQIEAYNAAYLEYQKVAGSAGGQNPIVVTLTKRMDATRSAASRSLDNLRNNLELKLQELTRKRQDIAKRLTATSGKARELTPLDREHRVKEELYLTLLSKELENDLTLALTESSRARAGIRPRHGLPHLSQHQKIRADRGGGGSHRLHPRLPGAGPAQQQDKETGRT